MGSHQGQMPVLVLLASSSSLCMTAAMLAALGLAGSPWLSSSLAWASIIPMLLFVWVIFRSPREPEWTATCYPEAKQATELQVGLPRPALTDSASDAYSPSIRGIP